MDARVVVMGGCGVDARWEREAAGGEFGKAGCEKCQGQEERGKEGEEKRH